MDSENVLPLNEVKNKARKVCFVPLCNSSSVKNPSKLFFNVPKDVNMKKKWFQVAHREYLPSTSNFFCCEDHFNVSIGYG